MFEHDNIYKLLAGTLLSMLVLSLVIAGLVFTAPTPALAANDLTPLETDAVGLGCVCVQFNYHFYECCTDAYWHEASGGNPGWLECRGDTYFEWYLPYGCDIWD